MVSFNVELNSDPVRNSNEYTLMLRITVNRKHARIALMYSVEPGDFNKKAKNRKYIRTSHPKHKLINEYIDRKISKAKGIIAELENDGKCCNGIQFNEETHGNPQSDSFCLRSDLWVSVARLYTSSNLSEKMRS